MLEKVAEKKSCIASWFITASNLNGFFINKYLIIPPNLIHSVVFCIVLLTNKQTGIQTQIPLVVMQYQNPTYWSLFMSHWQITAEGANT